MSTTTVRDRQRLYGLTFETDFPLHQDRTATDADANSPVVTVILDGRCPRADNLPVGEVLLDFAEGGDHWYSLVRRPDRSLVFRVYALCDFEISADLGTVSLRMVEGVDEGMASVMVVGTLAALQLYLRGELVLHASAVARDGRAVAFTGHSGMGKSTLAALLAAAGAAVISDDVLPVHPGAPTTVRAGSTELRLRPGTKLVDGVLRGVAAGERTSADRREVVRFHGDGEDALPLDAILVPWPNRVDRLEMERLSPQQAMLTLMSFPRLMGWRDPEVLRAVFAHVADVVRTVPVFRAHVPWGPPFRDDVADAVWQAVSETAQAGAASL
jgi:hypothetical protein